MISLNWVKDYIDIKDENLKDLAVKITKAGVNVEAVIEKRIDHLVIGEVVQCEKHPDSDHLNICQVNVGEEIVQIVCGASNVRKGIKVIVALPGAILPGNFEIKKGKIRGCESNGMICALFELGLEEKTEETYSKGIEEVPHNIPVGSDANEYLKTDDTLYELDVHKHRNNDCYYHIGFAYEIACILNKKVTLPKDDFKEIEKNIKDFIDIKVKTDKCPYYTAKMVSDIEIKESPEFIKQRLIAAGMRPINNVVDISNYVMLEYGQPLHFFDYDKLGRHVLVRDAKEKEEIITLDGNKRTLRSTDIVITDGKKPVCIAGVMGGENTEVDENTKTIFIESAIFDAVRIRYTANHLDLKSEASIRYGKGLNFEYTDAALRRACHLLQKYANAKVYSGTLCHDKVDKTKKVVTFKTEEVSQLLGLHLTDNDVKTELKRLDFPFEVKNQTFQVTIPRRRLDIDPNVNDIAEEIGRLYGYHNLVSTLPKVETRRGVYVGDVKLRKEISRRLRTLGLNEVKTYTLISPEMANHFVYEQKKSISLPNPMSVDKSIIRSTLLPSLVQVYEYNKARNIKDILLYEISKTYDSKYQEDSKVAMLMKGNYIINEWQGITTKCDFYCMKGIVENLLDYLGFKNRYTFEKEKISDLHPGMCAKILLDHEEVGIMGRIHPSYVKEEVYVCELSMKKLYEKQIKPLKFKETSKYPSMIKDVAFLVDNEIQSDIIKEKIKKLGGRLLESVEVFDLYENIEPGKKSIAYKLTFQDNNRTLEDSEVLDIFHKIIQGIEATGMAKLRDK